MSGIRRIVAAAAAVVVGAVGVVVVAAPAAQAAPTCFPSYFIHHYPTPSSHIESEAEVICYDPTEGYPLPAKVEKYNAVTGTWTVVATGTGYAWYTCAGTATTTYRTGVGARHKSVTAPCG